jgi:hypothetical protein
MIVPGRPAEPVLHPPATGHAPDLHPRLLAWNAHARCRGRRNRFMAKALLGLEANLAAGINESMERPDELLARLSPVR